MGVECRLKATLPMSGTLRVTRVPYEETHSQYDDAVSLLDQYSGSYPTKAKLVVSDLL